jgi:hypothetical protein
MTENLYHCIDCDYSCQTRNEIYTHCEENKDPNNYSNNHGFFTSELKKVLRDGTWLVGNIGVDSGTMMFGDSCYIKHDESLFCEGQTIKDADGNDVTLPNKWDDFCERFSREQHLPHISGDMFYTGSFGGDGEFPVTVEIKNGQVKSAKINFSGRSSRLPEMEYDYERANVEESRKQGRLVMEAV